MVLINVRFVAAAMTAALVAFFGPVSSLAQTPAPAPSASPAAAATVLAAPVSPVALDLCRVSYLHYGPLGLIKEVGGLNIKFTNEGDKTIIVARFALTFNKNTLSIRDVGTFSPNITINHNFKDLTGENTAFGFSHEEQPTRCFVSFLKFADGTFWQAPDGPDDSAPAANVPVPSPTPVSTQAPSPSASP